MDYVNRIGQHRSGGEGPWRDRLIGQFVKVGDSAHQGAIDRLVAQRANGSQGFPESQARPFGGREGYLLWWTGITILFPSGGRQSSNITAGTRNDD